MPITMVAAVARNGVIGRDGGLPWHLPEDLRRFKAMTMDHVLVMGRKTFESIGRPLPGRTTIVVTRQPDWSAPEGVLVAPSVETALQQAAALDDDVFVVGGADIYRQALDRADVLELTEVDADPDGDVHFPAVDRSTWAETSRIVGDGFDFVTYMREQG
ncbi:MAG TPA: dihydrofolate reductase [Acidimicrobiia bacterium]|nr:dihydrofolate reductase [Acidimicrobiia bacterium]